MVKETGNVDFWSQSHVDVRNLCLKKECFQFVKSIPGDYNLRNIILRQSGVLNKMNNCLKELNLFTNLATFPKCCLSTDQTVKKEKRFLYPLYYKISLCIILFFSLNHTTIYVCTYYNYLLIKIAS